VEIDINNYIDYDSLFEDLFQEQTEELLKHCTDVKHYYDRLVNFHMHHSFNKKHGAPHQVFEIQQDECSFNDNEIVIVYVMDFDDANENCTQSSTADYTIIFNRKLNKFISCNYTQG